MLYPQWHFFSSWEFGIITQWQLFVGESVVSVVTSTIDTLIARGWVAYELRGGVGWGSSHPKKGN